MTRFKVEKEDGKYKLFRGEDFSDIGNIPDTEELLSIVLIEAERLSLEDFQIELVDKDDILNGFAKAYISTKYRGHSFKSLLFSRKFFNNIDKNLEEFLLKSLKDKVEESFDCLEFGLHPPNYEKHLNRAITQGEEEQSIEAPLKFDYSTDQGRKEIPLFSGLIEYFPDALKHVAHCSKIANDQHNQNQPLHWNKDKSKQELDSMLRHLIDSVKEDVDSDGIYHLTKVCWRALAELQRRTEGISIYKNY